MEKQRCKNDIIQNYMNKNKQNEYQAHVNVSILSNKIDKGSEPFKSL